MASNVREVLGHMTRVPGIVAAIFMKHDGSITAQSLTEGVEVETVRTLARDLLSRWEWIGADMGMGRPRMVVSTTPHGALSLLPVGPDAVLLAMGDRDCSVGRIRHELRRAGEAMRETDRVPQEVNPDLQRMMSAIAPTNGGAAGEPTIEWHRSGRPEAAPTEEIVVIGVHNFRLALKLVTALARAKGVRSASLKTYEPPRITIEVDAEGREALASIDGRSFGDCSLDVIARTAGRLILGVPGPVADAAEAAGSVR